MVGCIICKIDKELTDEHVIPEFLGGGLVVRNVCRDCNSSMGSGFEGRISNNFIYKGFRFQNNISGKSGIPFPLDGTYPHLHSSAKFKINRGGSIKSYPQCEVRKEGDKLKIHVSLDETDEEKAGPLLIKTIKRYLYSQGVRFREDKVSAFVQEFLAKYPFKKEAIIHPEIEVRGCFDFVDVDLLHMKVGYELACLEYGDEYISDPVADAIRRSLLGQKISKEVEIETPIVNDPFLTYVDEEHHWVIFWSNVCYINIAGIKSRLVFASEGADFPLKRGIVFKFCYRSGRFCVEDIVSRIEKIDYY